MGIDLYFLPPYSPELNLIESVFRQVKHQEIPSEVSPNAPNCGMPSSWAFPTTAGTCHQKFPRNHVRPLRSQSKGVASTDDRNRANGSSSVGLAR